MGSHGHFLQLQGAADQVAQALSRGDIVGAEISDAEKQLLHFAELLTRHAYKTTEADVQKLRDIGWGDEQIAEAVYITALFAFFNRVADAFGLKSPFGSIEASDESSAEKGPHA